MLLIPLICNANFIFWITMNYIRERQSQVGEEGNMKPFVPQEFSAFDVKRPKSFVEKLRHC